METWIGSEYGPRKSLNDMKNGDHDDQPRPGVILVRLEDEASQYRIEIVVESSRVELPAFSPTHPRPYPSDVFTPRANNP